MKDPTPWSQTDMTELERRLLGAAQDDHIPSDLRLHMAKALAAPLPSATTGAGADAAASARAGAHPAAGASTNPAPLGAPLFAKVGLWGSLVVLLSAAGYTALRPSTARVAPRAATSASESNTPGRAPSPSATPRPLALPPQTSVAVVANGSGERASQPLLAQADRARVHASGDRAAALDGGEPGGGVGSVRVELALLDRAREALGAGAHGRAQRLLDRHALRFARGVLGPEADALRIELLVQTGDSTHAVRLSRRFLRLHPDHPAAGRVGQLLAGL